MRVEWLIERAISLARLSTDNVEMLDQIADRSRQICVLVRVKFPARHLQQGRAMT